MAGWCLESRDRETPKAASAVILPPDVECCPLRPPRLVCKLARKYAGYADRFPDPSPLVCGVCTEPTLLLKRPPLAVELEFASKSHSGKWQGLPEYVTVC